MFLHYIIGVYNFCTHLFFYGGENMFKAQLNTNTLKSKVDKNIYGHFSEHLGRCIYGGLYVGEDSEIENVEGMRKDVLEAPGIWP